MSAAAASPSRPALALAGTLSPQEAASYWTDDRMASAEPAPMPEAP